MAGKRRGFARGTMWLALVLPAAAAAQDGGTVRIGQETKRTVGTITAMTAGDVACHLTLKDDRGARFEELADFDICEQRGLVGKRVALTYVQQKVLAPECQGDPSCKKSRTVALVATARPVAAAKPAPVPAPAQAASFCTATEVVAFTCRVGARQVSVCASRDAGPGRGYLQYRFGKPGEPLELVLPESRVAPAKAANGGSEAYSGGGGAWLRFFNRPTTYTVYTGIGNWGPKGEKRVKEGLLVERAGKPVATLPCTSKPESELGPDWFDKMAIVRGQQAFDFPE
ncbi:hypothetical protein [Reyranella sp.]|uniref:hypothetical protein n=1 Tax=Reyranella sp. TaxID=1929291 RepID=UPI003BABC645